MDVDAGVADVDRVLEDAPFGDHGADHPVDVLPVVERDDQVDEPVGLRRRDEHVDVVGGTQIRPRIPSSADARTFEDRRFDVEHLTSVE